MQRRLAYVEKTTGSNHTGPAWITKIAFSKTGRTVYFNGKALKAGHGTVGSHYDIETGEEYWVSGVKKRGSNRHWAGGGVIMIDKDAVEEYQELTGYSIDPRYFKIVELDHDIPKEKYNALENQKSDRDGE